MEYALIKNNKVENVIVADSEFISLISGEWDHIERIGTPTEQTIGVGIGWGWNGSDFVAPVVPPAELQPETLDKPWEWLIDIGPFFDRFGAAKMAVLTSADAGVQAILKDTQVRKWLDLKLPEIASAVAYIGTKVPAVTQGLQQSILNTPVVETENLALRKLYFS